MHLSWPSLYHSWLEGVSLHSESAYVHAYHHYHYAGMLACLRFYRYNIHVHATVQCTCTSLRLTELLKINYYALTIQYMYIVYYYTCPCTV